MHLIRAPILATLALLITAPFAGPANAIEPPGSCTIIPDLQVATPEGNSGTDDGSVFSPDYTICVEDVDGGCTVTEDAGLDLNVDINPRVLFNIQAKLSVDAGVHTTTHVTCEGTAKLDILHFGGLGFRGAKTILGETGTTQTDDAKSASSLAIQNTETYAKNVEAETLDFTGLASGSDSQHCQYLAQFEDCATHHTVTWAAERSYKGKLLSASGTVVACAALSLFNVEGTPLVANGPGSNTPLSKDEFSWTYNVCKTFHWYV